MCAGFPGSKIRSICEVHLCVFTTFGSGHREIGEEKGDHPVILAMTAITLFVVRQMG